jgi:hypothetical protein
MFSIRPLSDDDQWRLKRFHGRYAQTCIYIRTSGPRLPTSSAFEQFLACHHNSCSWVCDGTIIICVKIEGKHARIMSLHDIKHALRVLWHLASLHRSR